MERRNRAQYFFGDLLPEKYFTEEATERRREEMKNIVATSVLVREILEQFPETRNSDNRLYIRVIEKIDGQLLHKPIEDLLLNAKKYKIPPFESVRRTRQKLQSENSHLRANREVEEARTENEAVVRDYATDCAWK